MCLSGLGSLVDPFARPSSADDGRGPHRIAGFVEAFDLRASANVPGLPYHAAPPSGTNDTSESRNRQLAAAPHPPPKSEFVAHTFRGRSSLSGRFYKPAQTRELPRFSRFREQSVDVFKICLVAFGEWQLGGGSEKLAVHIFLVKTTKEKATTHAGYLLLAAR